MKRTADIQCELVLMVLLNYAQSPKIIVNVYKWIQIKVESPKVTWNKENPSFPEQQMISLQ